MATTGAVALPIRRIHDDVFMVVSFLYPTREHRAGIGVEAWIFQPFSEYARLRALSSIWWSPKLNVFLMSSAITYIWLGN
jgi:hypothetical protein